MTKNDPIVLGEHFEDFINEQILSGRFNSANEVVEAALRLFEKEESRIEQLKRALIKGEESGYVENFDEIQFLNELHEKYKKG
ncbi:MAG: type II toxin-antitoxin system ParD family antitoxin [Bacteroidetes bacterium]|nr:type II toxin-antitoxin system ParD family antitoxin [Bacteroidota bacterium]